MMMTGKILTDAGWAVPDSLRQAVVKALTSCPAGYRKCQRKGSRIIAVGSSRSSQTKSV